MSINSNRYFYSIDKMSFDLINSPSYNSPLFKYENYNENELAILIFSWNTQSLRLSDTPNLLMYTEPNDFLPFMTSKITEHKPHLVVIGFQEDSSPGSHFHSHVLPEQLPYFGYSLLKRNKCLGIGKTTYLSAMEGAVKFRGLRMSIYIRTDCLNMVENDALERDICYRVGNKGQKFYVSNIMCNKGALISYVSYSGHRTIAIICAHLPYNSQSLIDAKVKNNQMLRQNEINYSNIVFNNILESAREERSVKNIIYFGDFNYRISDPQLSALTVANDIFRGNLFFYYDNYDELKAQMERKNIYQLQEGINNNGPQFLPTAKMSKNRSDYETNNPLTRWKLGKYDQRIPSWTDRILYHSTDEFIECLEYDSYDFGETMRKSDHQGVYALLKIK